MATGVDGGWVLSWGVGYLAETHRAAGDAAAADARARELLELGRRLRAPAHISQAQETLGRLALLRGEYAAAEEALHDALALRAAHGLWIFVPPAIDALAALAAQTGRPGDAARMLGVAAGMRGARGLVRWLPDRAGCDALEATLREQLGDAAFAQAHDAGAALADDEALVWIRGARGRRGRPARGWESLTPTELRVAELVAAGMSNPQIGERMFITRATVKAHVAHIFGKLGISARTELAAEVSRRASS